jgi:hypothetical protein
MIPTLQLAAIGREDSEFTGSRAAVGRWRRDFRVLYVAGNDPE